MNDFLIGKVNHSHSIKKNKPHSTVVLSLLRHLTPDASVEVIDMLISTNKAFLQKRKKRQLFCSIFNYLIGFIFPQISEFPNSVVCA